MKSKAKQAGARLGYATNNATVFAGYGRNLKTNKRYRKQRSKSKSRGRAAGFTGFQVRTVKGADGSYQRIAVVKPIAKPKFQPNTSCGLPVVFAERYGNEHVMCVVDSTGPSPKVPEGYQKAAKYLGRFQVWVARFTVEGFITLSGEGTEMRRDYEYMSQAITLVKGYFGRSKNDSCITLRSSDMTLFRHKPSKTDRMTPTIDITG